MGRVGGLRQEESEDAHEHQRYEVQREAELPDPVGDTVRYVAGREEGWYDGMSENHVGRKEEDRTHERQDVTEA